MFLSKLHLRKSCKFFVSPSPRKTEKSTEGKGGFGGGKTGNANEDRANVQITRAKMISCTFAASTKYILGKSTNNATIY